MKELLWPSFLPASPWLRLAAAAAAVILAGIKLSRYGDLLSQRLRMGQAVVGMLFVAFATSLPEMVTSLGAVAVEKAPGLAVGNNFGSISFNLLVILVVDALVGKRSLFGLVSRRAARPGLLSLVLIAVFGGALALERLVGGPVIPGLRVGLATPVILATYLAGFWWLSRGGQAEPPPAEEEEPSGVSTPGLLARYGVVVLVILWAGLNLSAAGDQIAEAHGLSRTFVGVLFLAVATSLPELTVGISAARAGLYEMILGNIFGANIMNAASIATISLISGRNLFVGVSPIHALTGLVAILLMALAIGGMSYRSKRSFLLLGWDSWAMVAVYLGGMYVIFAGGG